MNHLGLFEGIGGFSLAAQWMGWKTIGWCEWDPFCQEVLRKNFPEVIAENQHGDITKTDFTKYRGTVDILTGGFPCQPYSSAGKRLGTADSRHLWPEMLRAIREVQPRYIVGENVRGLTNWNGGLVFDQVQADLEAEGYEVLPFLLPACGVNAPHRRDRIWFVAHAVSDGHGHQFGKSGRTEDEEQRKVFRQWDGKDFERAFFNGITANTEGHGDMRELQRLEGANGSKRKPKEHERGTWQNFPTVSPVRTGNNGLSSKLVRSAIKAGGNAIVPQVAYQIYKAIELTDL